MKNLKSPLIVLGCVLMLAVGGCRSGNNPPATGSQVTLTLIKNRAAIAGGGFHDGVVTFSVAPPTVDSTCAAGTASCTPTYPTGSVVTLTATATPPSTFNGWNRTECGSSATCTVTLASNFTLQAFFGPAPLTVGDVVILTSSTPQKLVSFNYSEPEIARTAVAFRVNAPATATTPAIIDGLLPNETVVGIDYQPTALTNSNPLLSRLIAVTSIPAGSAGAPGRLIAVSPTTGAVDTSALFPPRPLAAAPGDGFTGLVGTRFGVDYNPATRVMRVVSDAGQNLSIEVGVNLAPVPNPNPNPCAPNICGGVVTTDGTLSEPAVSGATVTGIAAAAYTNNQATFTLAGAFVPRATVLYVLNRNTRKLYVQNNEEGFLYDVATVTTPTAAPGNISDFDIRGGGVDITGRDVATAPDALYVNDAAGGAGTGASLYHLNLRDGRSTLVSGPVISGQIPVPINGANVNPLEEGVRSLAIRPTPAPAVGDVLAINDRNELISFSSTAPNTILTRNAIPRLYSYTSPRVPGQPDDTLVGFDFRSSNGLLYGVAKQGTTGRVYTINSESGLATLRGVLRTAANAAVLLTGNDHGVDFNPANGLLRVVSDAGQNIVVDADSAIVTAQQPLFRGTAPGSVARLTASAYTNNLPAAASTVLFGLDTTSTASTILVRQTIAGTNIGQVNNVGVLGVGAEGINGFDIDGFTGNAFAALRVGTVLRLYRIDLSSGTATGATNSGTTAGSTAADTIGSGSDFLVGISLRLPVVRHYGLLEGGSGRVIRFDPVAPGTLQFNLPVSALVSGGERLISLDYRASTVPAERVLYGISNLGRLYTLALTPTVDAPTAVVATFQRSLFPTGGSPAFSSFGTTADFGSDFRPIVGSASSTLHVVAAADANNAAQNVKINILDGGTQRDSNLTVNNTGGFPLPLPGFGDACDRSGAPSVGAIAYSNNVTSAPLYAVDRNTADSACLYIVDSVNGQMNAVSGDTALGFEPASSKMGLEITGPTDGQVLGAFDVTGTADTRSTLFSVNLTSGGATSIGLIGPAGTTKVVGITTSLKAASDTLGGP